MVGKLVAHDHCGLILRADAEADNCASALWLFSSATALLLLRFACCCFAYLAKNIRSVRCRKFSANNSTPQKRTGPKKAKWKTRDPNRPSRKKFPVKIVS